MALVEILPFIFMITEIYKSGYFRDHVNLDDTKKRQQIVSEYNISNKPTSVCADYCIRDAHCYGFNIESMNDDSSHKSSCFWGRFYSELSSISDDEPRRRT